MSDLMCYGDHLLSGQLAASLYETEVFEKKFPSNKFPYREFFASMHSFNNMEMSKIPVEKYWLVNASAHDPAERFLIMRGSPVRFPKRNLCARPTARQRRN
jgi:hypothetical protein